MINLSLSSIQKNADLVAHVHLDLSSLHHARSGRCKSCDAGLKIHQIEFECCSDFAEAIFRFSKAMRQQAGLITYDNDGDDYEAEHFGDR